jgi:hypothetical protein
MGAQVSGGNPYAIAGGALAMGTVSYFGGASQRKLEKKANDLSLQSMEQDLTLGDLNISETRRNRAKSLDADKKKQMFGQMLAEYFQKKGAA